ncbi:(2Fe-2S)-binding protein [Bradyrhizobium sp.]|jgi:carbon-monoxide dehydrogenase small subunit|uniref:(2Fe-2S)-binding protein n=1 Tax=Bradyrhizobium sp. TaxID=376 RepID=UPI003C1AF479
MTIKISLTVNGEPYDVADVEPRLLLSDFLRDTLGLTGTHVGCEHGVCGACTVLMNGDSVRSCLMLAVQANGAEIVTVEGLGSPEDLNVLQAEFREHHGLQCGFCTPGMLMTGEDLLQKYPLATDDDIRKGLSGNLCRCTGYQNIVAAIRSAAAKRTEKAP